jgi:proteasome lid subunit RPN8/RPN11
VVPSIDDSPLAARLASLAEDDPGREVCGFVAVDGRGGLSVVPLRNVAEDGREAYVVDPAAHLALARRLRLEGGRIAAVYHSHVDGPACLSPADIDGATDGHAPVLPGVDQIVIGLRSGKVQEIKVFTWQVSGFAPAAAPEELLARRVAMGAR